jgi:hypothetical protein
MTTYGSPITGNASYGSAIASGEKHSIAMGRAGLRRRRHEVCGAATTSLRRP